ncbi:M24 family metallopeptidase [Anaerobium acetethylicum]|uniref:Xaa-Pro aminopeptidase n=1 Tax=Anaerobium acetethylicum TaxID=1619234 RepID=A0A1D3TVB1_9FIRM|nr:aminopeptidase P family protein [Anaerobium acetethylicum]SCP98080.1 Xaa-Pro aminopeptidase [Anaerobium acetethylicum]
MNSRYEKIIGLINEKSLDAVWITDAANMRYLSGYTGGTGSLYISKNRKAILTDSRYTTQARHENRGFDVIEVSGSDPYVTALNKLLQEDKVRNIGFEDEVMIYSQYKKYKEMGKAEEWVALGGAVDSLRVIKTADELKSIEKAEAIGDKAFNFILGIIKPGMTEIEIAVELECFMKRNGAEGLSFDSIVASGVNSSMPHATPGHKKIEKGDFVTMDFGCVYEGYCSDMTRTIVIGKADDKQKEIYNLVLEAQTAALEAVRPGVSGASIDKVARDIIAAAGYGEYFGHGLGHSVGLYIHENPRLSPLDSTIILENMTETVEPGIYIPDKFGVRIEDLVAVTAEGCVNFTHSPKNLIEIR